MTEAATYGDDLRLRDPALRRVERVSFRFNGKTLTGYPGESIAAALIAAGIAGFGRRRDGSSRAVFCGMGVCQECLVKVEGVTSVRACMVSVTSGMEVTSQDYAVPSCHDASIDRGSATSRHRPQVLIVGAGPAGLSAARAAVLSGAKALIVDERSEAGGQYFKQVAKSHAIIEAKKLDSQVRRGRDLIAEVERLGVTIWRDAVVWGAFGADEIAVNVAGRQHILTPERLVLATGAYERGVAVPGWTLPGYMTTGAAQTLVRTYRVLPGRRVLVAGNGPLNFQLAAELVRAGARVVAVIETAASRDVRHAPSLWRAAMSAPALIREGLGYATRLSIARVPILYGSAVLAAHGEQRVEECSVAKIDAAGRPVPGTAVRFSVDCVCTSYGFLPSNEIARALGCRHTVHSETGGLETLVDEDGLSSAPRVYAIGDAAAFRGAHAAAYQGFITGCAASRSLGLTLCAAVEEELANARRQLRKHLVFQAALWRMFAAPTVDVQYAAPDTVVCRCESVTRQAVEGAVRDGAVSLGAIKRRTRIGMGRCQGRYCESLVAVLMERELGSARDEASGFAPRIPFKPIRVKDLL